MKKSLKLALFLFTLFCCTEQAVYAQKATAYEWVRNNAAQLHLPSNDADYVISDAYTDDKTALTYIYLQQRYQGIKVFNRIKSTLFKNGQLLYQSGSFIKDIAKKAGSGVPSVSSTEALQKAALHLQLASPQGVNIIYDLMQTDKKIILSGGNLSKNNIEAALMWVSTDDGATVRLAWNINIDVAGKADWWNIRIDAANGQYLSKNNWTVHEQHKMPERKFVSRDCITTSSSKNATIDLPNDVTDGSYRVIAFPSENPNNTAGFTIENNPWLKAGPGNNAITNGWHFDGTNNYNITRGNNVHAYLDILTSNTPGGSNSSCTSSTAIPVLTFTNVPNLSASPSLPVNKNAAVTNLFYWNNIIHDVMYQYGFTEPAGNFQTDNLGRGGLGNDYVQAEAQDGGGTNNANFSTPTDGSRPRMQMYLWDGVTSMVINTPASIAGSYNAVEGNISANNTLVGVGPVSGEVVYLNDDASGSTHLGCGSIANNISGKIALIDRGTCSFATKVLNVQNAGAIGVIMVNNVPGAPFVMGGADNNILIPAVMISQSDGAIIAAQLSNGVTATLSQGPSLDGDYDNGVVTHEFGHGISNRLTGGPANSSCLGNAEQGGEGWSDYFALMLTTNWANTTLADSAKPRAVGNYVTGSPSNGPGIRRYPYSIDKAVNPLTYSNMDGTAAGSQVHNIGEIWCSALWDMTWAIIKQQNSITTNIYNSGGNGGNVIALRLVMEGLKLQACNPGYLDARNAILAADSILYNNAHKCAIWYAFARRGMGFSASQGSSFSTADNTVAFDVPGNVVLSKNAYPIAVNSGSNYTINLQATCSCLAPISNFRLVDTLPAGFTYQSSNGGTLSGNTVTFSGIGFTTSNEVKNFTINVIASGSGCNVDSLVNDNRDANTTGGLTPSSLFSTNTFSQSNTVGFSGTRSWFAPAAADSSDFVLTSAPFTPQNLSLLSFWHRHAFEEGYDGSRIEISTDGGTNWLDAAPYFLQRPYNYTMLAGPWGNGARAYSSKTNQQFVNTVLNLGAFNGQNIRVRFRVRTDTGNPGTYEGWFIDDILALRGCGGFSKANLFTGTGARADSSWLPLYIRPAVVTSINNIPNNNVFNMKLYPNPAEADATLSFSLAETRKVNISITDLNGKVIYHQSRGNLVAGNYVTILPSRNLASGIYIVSLQAGNVKQHKKLILHRK